MPECQIVERRRGQIVCNEKTGTYWVYIYDERFCETYQNDEDHECSCSDSLTRQYHRSSESGARALLAEKLAEPPNLSASNK